MMLFQLCGYYCERFFKTAGITVIMDSMVATIVAKTKVPVAVIIKAADCVSSARTMAHKLASQMTPIADTSVRDTAFLRK